MPAALMSSRRALLAVVLAVAGVVLAACGSGSTGAGAGSSTTTAGAPGGNPPGGARPTVVATTPVLGALVRAVVGDRADVVVVMPEGADPHGFEPSARDVATMRDADLLVVSGLNLEEGLLDAVAEARAAGTPVFVASDHVTVRTLGDASGGQPDVAADDHGHDDEQGAAHYEAQGDGTADEHGHGSQDPHWWTDPVAAGAVVAALPDALAATGLDVRAQAGAYAAELAATDQQVRDILAAVPDAGRKLVTGHESLGYFADRYGFELVGAVVPSLSSQAEASAGELARLAEQIRAAGVTTVFVELGTPEAVADAVAAETGARVVQLPSHTLPADGTYTGFLVDLATRVRDGLTG